ncbi:HNH endonuclease [Burkholderia sp. Bp9012]|uniref:HNH endonuclease n=1 Tax=Burkholderia sp. Bp9012 TaxID=2184562 RepID=UPI000F5A13B8|nr:HNH endonuclease [Burkholderia sp. Bp9012]RQR78349.1 HNH endonuclease [Burkholderia sp. Bp9012]
MPARPMKPCKHRGCGALVADGKSHCDQHAHEAVKWKPDTVRGNRHARGYGSAWEKIRLRILRRDCGLCQPCLQVGRVTTATAVDHVVSKARGGTDRDENLQAICRDCHATKTARERLQ